MSLETRTTPIWVGVQGGWAYPTGYNSSQGDKHQALAQKIKNATGLPISYCYSGGIKYVMDASIAVNFEGDVPPTGISGSSNLKTYIPAAVYFGLPDTNPSSSTTLRITICSGGTVSNSSWYTFDTGIAYSASSSNPELRPNLAFVNHGGKTFIAVATDSMSAGGHLVFGAIMDHTRRRIVGFRNLSGGTTCDTIVTIKQSGKFDNDMIVLDGGAYVYEDQPTYTASVITSVPPICSYNVVSMAPFVAPEEAAIIEDVFSPVYLRDDQDSQQFDISNSEYVSRYITSGCKTQGGSQFVVRFESVSNA